MADKAQEENSPLQVVMNELDELAEQWAALHQANGEWKCKRGRHRRKFRTPCEVWFFENEGTSVREESARTRNLSERGIGLITPSPIFEGMPVEVVIQPPDHPATYLGGVAVFCRYTQLGVYEVGVALQVHQDTPIFSVDPQKALARFPWLQRALRNMRWAAGSGETPPLPNRHRPVAIEGPLTS